MTCTCSVSGVRERCDFWRRGKPDLASHTVSDQRAFLRCKGIGGAFASVQLDNEVAAAMAPSFEVPCEA